MITATGTFRDATFADLPVGTEVRVISYGLGARKEDCGRTGTVIRHNRTRVVVQLSRYGYGVDTVSIHPACLTPVHVAPATLPTNVHSLRADELATGDLIHFGGEWVRVTGFDPANVRTVTGQFTNEVTVITDDVYVDYVDAARMFAVVTNRNV